MCKWQGVNLHHAEIEKECTTEAINESDLQFREAEEAEHCGIFEATIGGKFTALSLNETYSKDLVEAFEDTVRETSLK